MFELVAKVLLSSLLYAPGVKNVTIFCLDYAIALEINYIPQMA